MAARYWRVIGWDAYGADSLELTELQLWSRAARLDGSVSLTCSATPDSGTIAALHDGSLTGAVVFGRAKYSAPGFSFNWDFGSPAAVEVVRIGAGTVRDKFPCQLVLQSSDDGIVWATFGLAEGVAYPGANTLTAYDPSAPVTGDRVFMRFEGADGSTTMTDQAGHTWTAVGTAALSTSGPLDGGSSLLLDGSGYLTSAAHADYNVGNGSFFLAMSLQFSNTSARQAIIGKTSPSYGVSHEWLFFWTGTKFSFYIGVRGVWGTIYDFDSPMEITVGARYRVVFGRDSNGSFRLFVAGQLGNTVVSNAYDFSEPSTPFFPLNIGYTFPGDATGPFYGKIDDLVVHVGSGPSTAPLLGIRGPITTTAAPIRATALPVSKSIYKVLPPSTTTTVSTLGTVRVVDLEFGGKGRIAGTLKVTGSPNTPTHRKLRLYRDRDGLQVGETWSNAATGAYTFNEINPNYKYTVVALDYLNNYRAVVASNITPDPM